MRRVNVALIQRSKAAVYVMSALTPKADIGDSPMSALGHKRTYAVQKGMSALPPKADIGGWLGNVRFVPITDIAPFRGASMSMLARAGTTEALHHPLTRS